VAVAVATTQAALGSVRTSMTAAVAVVVTAAIEAAVAVQVVAKVAVVTADINDACCSKGLYCTACSVSRCGSCLENGCGLPYSRLYFGSCNVD
jgi:hypothetical protein